MARSATRARSTSWPTAAARSPSYSAVLTATGIVPRLATAPAVEPKPVESCTDVWRAKLVVAKNAVARLRSAGQQPGAMAAGGRHVCRGRIGDATDAMAVLLP